MSRPPETRGFRATTLLWLILSIFAGALWYACFLAPPLAKSLVARIPIGSGVESLTSVSNNDSIRDSQVIQWIPLSRSPGGVLSVRPTVDGATKKTNPAIHHKDLGSFETWSPPRNLRDTFTGEVMFFTKDEILVFRFDHGKVVEKGWGNLPG